MNQQIPKWVIVLLVVGIAAVLVVPPWQYNSGEKDGNRPEFKGWSPWWGERPTLTEGHFAGQPEAWTLHNTYLLYEIIGVCFVVLAAGAVAGKKQSAPVPEAEATPAPESDEQPPTA